MGTLSVVQKTDDQVNPFEVATDSFTLVYQSSVLNLIQLKGDAVVKMFGTTADNYYRVVIKQTYLPFQEHDILFVKPTSTPLIKGSLERIDYHGNGVISLYLNTSEVIADGALLVLQDLIIT